MKKSINRLLSAVLTVAILLAAAPLAGFVGIELSGFDWAIPAKALSASGDVDGDGYISARDARLALRGAIKLDTLTQEQHDAANLDGDAVISAADSRLILRAAVGLETISTPKLAASADEITLKKRAASFISISEPQINDGYASITVILNNCEGITASDMILSYDTSKLRFSYDVRGIDTEQLTFTVGYNGFNHYSNGKSPAGKIQLSMFFTSSLLNSEEYPALAVPGRTVDIDSTTFEANYICFEIIDNAVITADDFSLDVAIAEFADSSDYYDLSEPSAYASAEMRLDPVEGLMYTKVILNNCVGLQSFDSKFSYNKDKLTYVDCLEGADAIQVKDTQDNDFSQTGNGSNGTALIGGVFFKKLWTSEEFAANADEGKTVNIDDRSFECSEIVFKVKPGVTIEEADFAIDIFTGIIDGVETNLLGSLATSRIACVHSGGAATCINKAVCELCGEEYGYTGSHVDGNGDEICDICSAFVSEFGYAVLSDGTAEITEYIGIGGDVVIPDTIAGKSVVSVKDDAFFTDSALTSVTVPKGVTEIKAHTFGYVRNPSDFSEAFTKIPGFSIRGYAGSAAETYANANGFPFVNIAPHTHSYTEKVTTAATCTKAGVKTFTCTCADSYTEPINALGHTPGTWTEIKAASYTEKGSKQQKCVVCNAVLNTEEIPMLVRTQLTIDKTKNIGEINTTDKTVIGIPAETTVVDAMALFEDTASVEIRDINGIVVPSDDSKALLGTGCTVSRIDKNGKPTDTLTFIIAGDVDSDGLVSSGDARLALRQSVLLESFEGAFLSACDVDGNGVSSADARLILRFSVRLENTLGLK